VRPLIDTVDLEPKELPAPVPAPAPQPAPPAKPRTGWWAALAAALAGAAHWLGAHWLEIAAGLALAAAIILAIRHFTSRGASRQKGSPQ